MDYADLKNVLPYFIPQCIGLHFIFMSSDRCYHWGFVWLFFYWTNVKTFEHKIGIKCFFLFQDKRTELAELNMQKLVMIWKNTYHLILIDKKNVIQM